MRKWSLSFNYEDYIIYSAIIILSKNLKERPILLRISEKIVKMMMHQLLSFKCYNWKKKS